MEKDIEVCLSDTDLRNIQSSIKCSEFVQVFHYKGEENADKALKFLENTEGHAEIDKYRNYNILYFIKVGKSKKQEGVMIIKPGFYIVKYLSGKVYYYNQEELTRYYYKFSELSKKIEAKLNEVYKEVIESYEGSSKINWRDS